jgi:hypothetical protein
LPFDDGSLAVNDALTVCDVALCFCSAVVNRGLIFGL